MSHTNAWDETTPLNSEKGGKGAEEIRKVKTDIGERLALNHNMGGKLDTSEPDCEGTHKIITLKTQTAPTSVPTGAGILQMTEKDGNPELCKYSGSPVVETQITKDGKLNSNLSEGEFLSITSNTTEVSQNFIVNQYSCVVFSPASSMSGPQAGTDISEYFNVYKGATLLLTLSFPSGTNKYKPKMLLLEPGTYTIKGRSGRIGDWLTHYILWIYAASVPYKSGTTIAWS